MALGAKSTYWRSMLNRVGANRTIVTSTAPRMKPFAQIADHHAQDFRSRAVKGEFVPVYVVLGMIMVSVSLGLHTAKQELRYNPTVRVNKKGREKVVEVDEPEHVVEEADQYIKKSLFRRVAHVQGFADRDSVIYDPIRGDIFARKPKAETLKSVGVDPSKH